MYGSWLYIVDISWRVAGRLKQWCVDCLQNWLYSFCNDDALFCKRIFILTLKTDALADALELDDDDDDGHW